jgi:hypothetical protein
MPNESVGREVVRGTICRDRFQADVALLGADRVPEGAAAPLLVDIRWRAKRDDQLVPGVPEDQQPIVLSFAKASDAAAGEIQFDGGATTKGFAGDTRQLLTIHGTKATVGDAADVSLKVQIEGEERAALPMSVGATTAALAIRAEDGGEPPAALVAGQATRLKAVPSPAGAGAFRWLSVPEAGLDIVPRDGGVVEITARSVTGESQGPPGAPPAGPPPEPQSFTLFVLFDPEGDGPLAVATHLLTAGGGLFVHTERDGASVPLANGWVYWREGGTLKLLRTDTGGRLSSGPAGSDDPAEYTTQFVPTAGAAIEAAYSRGSVPLPAALVTPLLTRTVPAAGAPPILALPDVRLELTAPDDLSLWALSFAPHDEAYSTGALAQKAALWSAQGKLTVKEHDPAPAPPARPGVRGVTVTGRAEAGARSVTVRALAVGGATLADATATPSATGEFTATLAPTVFGPARLAVVADGPARPGFAALAGHLCGVQLALVADTGATAAGPVLGEADERIEVDFLASPQRNLTDLSAETRARRMVRYDIATRKRPLAAGGTAVLQPEMPLWMAELQLVGLAAPQLAALLARRGSAPLRIEVAWALTLSWDGPDANQHVLNIGTRAQQRHEYTLPLKGRQSVDLALDAGRQPVATLDPVPDRIPFPVDGRRLPGVTLTGAQRAWGRQGGATQPAVVVEWQPRVVDSTGKEIMRGGDGLLEATEVKFAGRPLEGPLRLPAFRVRGLNPSPAADVDALTDALIEEYHTAHAAEAKIQMLTLDGWKTTVKRIFKHESGQGGSRQFDNRGALRPSFGSGTKALTYGLEDTMPIFGPPHGYGIGQLDFIFGRGANEDEVWSFVENIRSAIKLLMDGKAGEAYNVVSGHLPNPIDQRTRAVFQRELVRRYNGGDEFQFEGGAFKIHPTKLWADKDHHEKGPNPNLLYPNQVLGTSVIYFTNAAGKANTPDGADTQFSMPVTFTAADFGPGI